MSNDFSIAELPEETQNYIRGLRSEAARYRTERNEYQTKYADVNNKFTEAGTLLQQANQNLEELSAVKDTNEQNAKALAELTEKRERELIAWQNNLTPDDAGRLQGANAEEWKADAEKLASRLAPTNGRRTPPKDPAAGTPPTDSGDGKASGIRKAFEDAGLL